MKAGTEHELSVAYGHDYFTVGVDDEEETVRVDLWSRGTFTVTLRLAADDARKLAAALSEVADQADVG